MLFAEADVPDVRFADRVLDAFLGSAVQSAPAETWPRSSALIAEVLFVLIPVLFPELSMRSASPPAIYDTRIAPFIRSCGEQAVTALVGSLLRLESEMGGLTSVIQPRRCCDR